MPAVHRSPARQAILAVILGMSAIQGITPDPGDLASSALFRIAGNALGLELQPLPRPLIEPGGDSTDEVCSPLGDARGTLRFGVPHLRDGGGPALPVRQLVLLALLGPFRLLHRKAAYRAGLHELCRLTC